MIRRLAGLLFGIVAILAFSITVPLSAKAATNYNRVIDDSIFDNTGTMTAAKIDTFLNSFSTSCVSPNSGFSAPDPIGYSPTTKYTYGPDVSAGTVIYDAAQAYGINPQVLLTTLEKEQGLITGTGRNVIRQAGNTTDCGALAMSAALGYNCPDTTILTPYSGFEIYAHTGAGTAALTGTTLTGSGTNWSSGMVGNNIVFPDGNTFKITAYASSTSLVVSNPSNVSESAQGYRMQVMSVQPTCVRNASYVGFSRQVIIAAWQFTFDRHRSEGQNNWAVIKTSWDNSDDLTYCYSHDTVAGGPYYLCPDQVGHTNDPYISHSGQYSIDSTIVTINNGATAALYNYTPHLHGQDLFTGIFNNWFGATLLANLPGCPQATNTTIACVWNLSAPINTDQYLTSSITARDVQYANNSYTYHGVDFFGNVIIMPGNVPIYRASVAGGGSFLTTSLSEYNNLIAAGYTGNGVDFYADPAGSNAGYAVYRLYNPGNGQHYWTPNVSERATLLAGGWNDEGIAFNSISTVRQETPAPTGKLLVYRFYIPQTYSHFWTTDLYERDQMILAGYQYEGVAWDSSASTLDAPVYRLYAPSISQHLYTTDLNEKNVLAASGGWVFEGISEYVSQTVTSQPVYRLYAPSLGVHHLTADSYERSQLIASGRWKDEGIAWYQP